MATSEIVTARALQALSKGALEWGESSMRTATPLPATPGQIQLCNACGYIIANTEDGTSVYRIVMSDSLHFAHGILINALGDLVNSERLKRYTVFRLSAFEVAIVKSKCLLIATNLEILDELHPNARLGNPTSAPLLPTLQEEGGEDASRPSPVMSGKRPHDKDDPVILHRDGAGTTIRRASELVPTAATEGNDGSLAPLPQPDTMPAPPSREVYPIKEIHPYANRWTLKARCVHKSPIKTWSNQKGEGRLFSVHFKDETGEIKATGFQAECDRFHRLLSVGTLYYISTPCLVKETRREFQSLQHDYELTFNKGTVIGKAEEDGAVPSIAYRFISLDKLGELEKDMPVDTIGVMEDTGKEVTILTKAERKELVKRELTLVDESSMAVMLTIWGDLASSFETPVGAVLALKDARVSDFGGKSLTLPSTGTMVVEPDIERAKNLKSWHQTARRPVQYQWHRGKAQREPERMTVEQILARGREILGESTPRSFATKVTITYIKPDSLYYPACLGKGEQPCQKKVTLVAEDEWWCDRCSVTHPKPNWRYITTIKVRDHTLAAPLYLTCFDDAGGRLFGLDANAMAELEASDKVAWERRIADATFQQVVLVIRAKSQPYEQVSRIQYSVTRLEPMNFVREGKKLVELLREYRI